MILYADDEGVPMTTTTRALQLPGRKISRAAVARHRASKPRNKNLPANSVGNSKTRSRLRLPEPVRLAAAVVAAAVVAAAAVRLPVPCYAGWLTLSVAGAVASLRKEIAAVAGAVAGGGAVGNLRARSRWRRINAGRSGSAAIVLQPMEARVEGA